MHERMLGVRLSSGELVLAAGPQPLLGLELCHTKQVAEHLEPMALGELDQFGNSFSDEGHGLVRASLSTPFFGWRSPRFARSRTLPTAASLAQKICIQLA